MLPDFGALGDIFWKEWKTVFPMLWAVGVLVAIFFLGRGLLAMARAQESGTPQERRTAITEASCGGGGFAGLIALGTIIQIYWNVFF